MTDKLISIIVPLYNDENYVERCVKSICVQTYSNIEIILVDDGSTDNTLSICNELSKFDDRILVFHCKHQGVSATRNFGLEKSKGDFFMFVDGDDVVNHSILEILLNDIEVDNCDIASCRLDKEADVERLIMKAQATLSLKQCERKGFDEAFEHLVTGDLISACCRLYRASTLKTVRFPIDYKYNEDKYYVYLCLSKGNRFSYRDEKLYIQHWRLDSSSKIGYYSLDTIKLSELILLDIETNHKHLSRLAYKNDLQTCRNSLHQLFKKKVLDSRGRKPYFIELRTRMLNIDRAVWKEEAFQYKIEKKFITLGYIPYKFFYLLWSKAKRL